jgi:hypothetical protein
MSGGALIPGGVPRGSVQRTTLTADEMKFLVKRALFMHIIPTAWKNNKDANVAILDTRFQHLHRQAHTDIDRRAGRDVL